MFVTLTISFGLPLGLALFARLRWGRSFSFIPLLAGCAAFVVSQIILRTALLQGILPLFDWYRAFAEMKWPFYIFLSFTAGLFEEPARYIVFSLMKKRRSFVDGLSYGIGHGGTEAILLIGLTYVNNIILSLVLNGGYALPDAYVTALTGTPSYLFLVAGIERIFAVTFQIALSLLVLQGFRSRKKLRYLLVAILLHGCANLGAFAFNFLGTLLFYDENLGGVLVSELFLLIVATLSVWYIVTRAREWREEAPPLLEGI